MNFSQSGACSQPVLPVPASPLVRMRTPKIVGLLTCGLFVATTLPLTLRAIRRDQPLVPLIALFVFLRSVAQGFGIFVGLVTQLAERIWDNESLERFPSSFNIAIGDSNDETDTR